MKKFYITIIILSLIILTGIIFYLNIEKTEEENNISPLNKNALSSPEVQALNLAIDGKFKSRAVSWKALNEFGETAPFEKMAESEQQVIDYIKIFFTKYSIQVPENEWLMKINFNSTEEACKKGINVEEENIRLYDEFSGKLKNQEIIELFSFLKSTAENNIKIFENC
ncbi:MAG: hypothetical protein PHC28_12395 [Flavobacterium sp.]|uniref:hypothetical protein n=1 Tax=Flavobacterium sp. TaxID=239 RepID=UPI002632B4FE|nr:hypothetical protein [Flavobacterium sp.]MDD5151254.1 hypothetical protein [Flavobacterium sp.]